MTIHIKKGNALLILLSTLILAIGPIFDPYIFVNIGSSFSLKILDLPLMALAFIVLISYKSGIVLDKKDSLFLVELEFVFLLLTVLSFIYPEGSRSFSNAIKNCGIELIYCCCITFVWLKYDHLDFVRLSYIIAVVGTAFLVIQYIFVNLGLPIFDGRIPFLQIGKYDYWARLIDPNTGDIRVHSFFQEPAYYGMYILPVFAHSLNAKRYKFSIFFLLGLLLSSSLVAILGASIIFLVYALQPETRGSQSGKVLKIAGVVVIGIVCFLLLYSFSNSFKNTVDYAIGRTLGISNDLTDERLGSNKIRLLGYVDRYFDYPFFFKVFGVGANQFSSYLGVVSYSNNIVTILLNYGLLGIIVFGVILAKLIVNTSLPQRILFIPFIIVCFTDYQWVNWYFFYLITWFIGNNETNKDRLEI